MCHEEIAVCERFGFRSVRVVRGIHEVDVELFTETTVAGPSHFEKVTSRVVQGCPEYNLFRVWNDTHQGPPGF